LPDSAENYQAEIAGISVIPFLYTAILPSLPTPPNSCHVFSDSKATLCGIKSTSKAKYPAVKHAYNLFFSTPLRFKFHWCKGHVGIFGNENVDGLAKGGADHQGAFHHTIWSKNQILRIISHNLQKTRNQTGTLLQTLPGMFSSPLWLLLLHPQLSYLVLNQNGTKLT
jgi:hypothetical protein